MDDNELKLKKQRLKEIITQKQLLSEELKEIEDDLKKTKLECEAEERKKYIGRCYKRKSGLFIDSKDTKYIEAFKILGISNNKNNLNYARCIAVSTHSTNCWSDVSIRNKVIGIWNIDEHVLIPKTKTLMIDNYEECTNDEFNTIIDNYMEIIIDHSDL